MLAPFWTDLDPASGGELRIGRLTDGARAWLVIDWFEVVNFADLQANSFEIWIGLNGIEDITFVYGVVSRGDLGFLTVGANDVTGRSEEHTSELQSLMRTSYAVFRLKKKNRRTTLQIYI